MKKFKSIAVLLLFVLLVGCSSNKGNLTSTRSSGESSGSATSKSSSSAEKVIKVGMDGQTPGWTQTDKDGKIDGFEHDMWEEISKRTGYKVEYTIIDFESIWPMIDSDRLDVIANQVTLTEERKEKYEHTSPYAYNVYCLIARKDNEELRSIEDIKDGMSISCETNSSDEKIVEALNNKYNVKLKPVFFEGMSVQEVALGRCDLWPRAETSAMITIKEVDNLKILGKTPVLESDAYFFNKSDRGKMLREVVDKALDEMRNDGTIKNLSEKWFNVDISVKPEGVEIEL